MKVALIISTYNRPDALELTLMSAMQQTVLPDEVIIADDGSTDATRELIDRYRSAFAVPLIHVWHEDDGFRLSMIRNKAIAASTADYLIQVDGDLILHPRFVQDHRQFARPNSVVRASRIYLSPELTEEKITTRNVYVNRFGRGVENFFSAFRIPFLWRLFEKKYKIKGSERWEIHGCNMAYWRSDAIRVNGYNEDFMGWGPEDKEFVVRLLNSGVHKRFMKFGGIVYHLWHPINAKENLGSNEQLFEDAKSKGLVFCTNGIDKYLDT